MNQSLLFEKIENGISLKKTWNSTNKYKKYYQLFTKESRDKIIQKNIRESHGLNDLKDYENHENPLLLFTECNDIHCSLTRSINFFSRDLFERKITQATQNKKYPTTINWTMFGALTTQEFFLIEDFIKHHPECTKIKINLVHDRMNEYIEALIKEDPKVLDRQSLPWIEHQEKEKWLEATTCKFLKIFDWFTNIYPQVEFELVIYGDWKKYSQICDIFTAVDYYDQFWQNLTYVNILATTCVKKGGIIGLLHSGGMFSSHPTLDIRMSIPQTDLSLYESKLDQLKKEMEDLTISEKLEKGESHFNKLGKNNAILYGEDGAKLQTYLDGYNEKEKEYEQVQVERHQYFEKKYQTFPSIFTVTGLWMMKIYGFINYNFF